jgi:hypothetical protein
MFFTVNHISQLSDVQVASKNESTFEPVAVLITDGKS